MTATIEQIVNLLETKANPEDPINFSIDAPAFWKAQKEGKTHSRVDKGADWDYVVIDKGFSKVKDVLNFLKQFVPDFKDRGVALWHNSQTMVSVAAPEITETKVWNLDFSKKPKDLPRFVEQTRKEALDKFTEVMQQFTKVVGSTSNSLVPLAQHFIIQHPEVGSIYLIGSTFYPSFSDVQTAYPELADKQMDNLFKPCDHGVFECRYTSDEMEYLQQEKKNIYTKYVSDVGTFSREELLKKFNLTEAQIDKLFTEQDGVMKCGVDGLLARVAK